MRMAVSTGVTKILPSPMLPVLAAAATTSATLSTNWSGTTTSILIFGRKSTVYSPPRYSSVWPFCRPKPRTSDTVMPITPMEVSASLTSSSLNGLMIASIFFIRDPPGRVHSNRRARGCSRQKRGKSVDSTTGASAGRARLPRKWARAGAVPAFRALGRRLGPALRDAVLAHLRVERRTPEPEQRRRRLLVPLRGLKRAQDRGPLDLLERADGHFGRRHRRRHTRLGLRRLERLGE